MRKLFSVILCATLPLAAGFAIKAHAQGLQYSGPGDAQSISASQSGAQNGLGDMTKAAQMDQQIRDLTNQLEQRDNQIRQLQTGFDKYKADTDMRLKALEDKAGATPMASATTPAATPPVSTPMTADSNPPAPTPVQNPVSGGVLDPNGAFQPSATPSLGQITEKNGTPAADGSITSGTPQGTAPAANAAQAYDKAFSYLQQSNYTDAQTAFTDFLKTYPTHPLAANAQYWLGETYYAQTQYSTAAKTFAKAFQDHPSGQKAPDALLKLAMTLDKMNKRPDACLTLGELTKRFPAGPASVLRTAGEERKRMECKA